MLIFPLIFVVIFSQIEGNIDVGKKENFHESKELIVDVDRLNDDLSNNILVVRPRTLQSFANRNIIRRNDNPPAESPKLYEKQEHSKTHNNFKRQISKRKNLRKKHRKQLKKSKAYPNSTQHNPNKEPSKVNFQYNNESNIAVNVNYHDKGNQQNLNFINPAEEGPEDSKKTENFQNNPKDEKHTLNMLNKSKDISENRYLKNENVYTNANARLYKDPSFSKTDMSFNVQSRIDPKEEVQNQTVIENTNARMLVDNEIEDPKLNNLNDANARNISENIYLKKEDGYSNGNPRLYKDPSFSKTDMSFNVQSRIDSQEEVQNQAVTENANTRMLVGNKIEDPNLNNLNDADARNMMSNMHTNLTHHTDSNCLYSNSNSENKTIAKYNDDQEYPVNKTVTMSKHIVYTPAGKDMYDKTEYRTLHEVEFFKDHSNIITSNISYNKITEPVENSVDTDDTTDSDSYLDRVSHKEGTLNTLINSDKNINKITHELVRIPYKQQTQITDQIGQTASDCCNVDVIENMKALYIRHLKDCYQALELRKESKYDVLGTTACVAECAAIRDHYVDLDTTIVDDKILTILKCSFGNMPRVLNILDSVVNTCTQRFKSFPPGTYPCRQTNILEVGRCIGGILQSECNNLYPPQSHCHGKLRRVMREYCGSDSPGYGCDLPKQDP